MGRRSQLKQAPAPAPLLKLDFGCGPNKREGFQGVDLLPFERLDFICDLRVAPWTLKEAVKREDGTIYGSPGRDPMPDNSVAEAHSSHFIEHLTAKERVLFCNELYRVLVPGGTCQIIIPHWNSCRAYGDPTHQWPPVSEFWFYYLSAEWRAGNAPHTDKKWNPDGFSCHFWATWGYSLRPDLSVRNQEYQQFAIANYKEVCTDIIATLTKQELPK